MPELFLAILLFGGAAAYGGVALARSKGSATRNHALAAAPRIAGVLPTDSPSTIEAKVEVAELVEDFGALVQRLIIQDEMTPIFIRDEDREEAKALLARLRRRGR